MSTPGVPGFFGPPTIPQPGSAPAAASGGGSTAPFVFWNPADKASGIVLSNGNLTATYPIGSPFPTKANVRANLGRSSGKYYFEITVSAIGDTSLFWFGLANASCSLAVAPGLDANSIGCRQTQVRFNGSSPINGGSTFQNGDVTGLAVDLGALKIWFRTPRGSGPWNNDVIGSQNPATGTGGFSIAGFTAPVFPALFEGTNDGGANMTGVANFGASSFTNTPPTGFTAWGSGAGSDLTGTTLSVSGNGSIGGTLNVGGLITPAAGVGILGGQTTVAAGSAGEVKTGTYAGGSLAQNTTTQIIDLTLGRGNWLVFCLGGSITAPGGDTLAQGFICVSLTTASLTGAIAGLQATTITNGSMGLAPPPLYVADSGVSQHVFLNARATSTGGGASTGGATTLVAIRMP